MCGGKKEKTGIADNGRVLAKKRTFTTKVDTKNQCLTYYKYSYEALKPLFCQYFVMRSPYFFVLIISKLETILKINEKYFEKSLQLSKWVVYLYQQLSK